MPVQIFPPAPNPTSSRPKRRRRWPRLLSLLFLLSLAVIGLVISSPWLLFNTAPGRTLLIAAANSSEDAHLALKEARLRVFPIVDLELDGLRLVRPFDPEAPTLALEQFKLLNLSRASSLPGRPLHCEKAAIQGIDAEIHQRWVQLHQRTGKPPSLPELFPRSLRAAEVEISDARYTVHQRRRGAPTRSRLTGIDARLEDFEWDFEAMRIRGYGRLTARRLELNDLVFERLEVPDFRADGPRLEFPSGTLTGMGGTIHLQGAIELQGGLPHPTFELEVKALDLARLIVSRPDADRKGPSPSGRLSLTGRLTPGAPAGPGEVAEPVLEGQLTLESFTVPLKQKSKLALKVLERLPGYIPGELPRLDLGTVRGEVRIADRQVELRDLRVVSGPVLLVIAGTIDQETDRLNLRMWIERAPKGEGEDSPAEQSSSGTEPAAPSPAPGAPPPAEAAAPVPSPAPTPAPTPALAPAAEEGLEARLAARKQALIDKVSAKKREIDEKAAEVKETVKARVEEVKEDLQTRVETMRTETQEKRAEIRADVEARTEGIRARIDQVRAALEEKREALMGRLEARFGRPELCITGTTAKPEIKLCEE